MDETARRREKQVAYNLEHDITPTTIVRRVADIMEGAHTANNGRQRRGGTTPSRTVRAVAEAQADYASLSATEVTAMLKKLETQMYQHAKNLEFEEAARVRDQIHELREQALH